MKTLKFTQKPHVCPEQEMNFHFKASLTSTNSPLATQNREHLWPPQVGNNPTTHRYILNEYYI